MVVISWKLVKLQMHRSRNGVYKQSLFPGVFFSSMDDGTMRHYSKIKALLCILFKQVSQLTTRDTCINNHPHVCGNGQKWIKHNFQTWFQKGGVTWDLRYLVTPAGPAALSRNNILLEASGMLLFLNNPYVYHHILLVYIVLFQWGKMQQVRFLTTIRQINHLYIF